MLYVFDVDGTLIRGFIQEEVCDKCKGEGRVMESPRMMGSSWKKCEPCKGKGRLFGEHLPYGDVEMLPGRREKLAELEKQGHTFAIATNQGGVAMGYQTEIEAMRKMAWVVHEMGVRRVSQHIAFHHPEARVEGYADPELVKLRKPNPGMIYWAMGAHNVKDRSQVVFVGDLPTDRDCAENAGVRFEWAEEFFGDD